MAILILNTSDIPVNCLIRILFQYNEHFFVYTIQTIHFFNNARPKSISPSLFFQVQKTFLFFITIFSNGQDSLILQAFFHICNIEIFVNVTRFEFSIKKYHSRIRPTGIHQKISSAQTKNNHLF